MPAKTITARFTLLIVLQIVFLKITITSTPAPFEPQNIVYIKVHKTGSSTFGGVIRRIAARHNLTGTSSREWISKEPGIWANHYKRGELRKKINLLKLQSFFITTLRDPAARCLSEINHFKVSRGQMKLDTGAKIRIFSNRCNSYQFDYIRDKGDLSVVDVLQSYDFIAISERFDESLVLLKYTLHLDWGDILYLKAKSEGSMDDKNKMILPYKKLNEEDEELKNFVENEWKETNTDYSLYNAALQRLENQIESTPSFWYDLKYFKKISKEAQIYCFTAAQYDQSKTLQSQFECYWKDSGCGVKCLNGFLTESEDT